MRRCCRQCARRTDDGSIPTTTAAVHNSRCVLVGGGFPGEAEEAAVPLLKMKEITHKIFSLRWNVYERL